MCDCVYIYIYTEPITVLSPKTLAFAIITRLILTTGVFRLRSNFSNSIIYWMTQNESHCFYCFIRFSLFNIVVYCVTCVRLRNYKNIFKTNTFCFCRRHISQEGTFFFFVGKVVQIYFISFCFTSFSLSRGLIYCSQ